MKPMLPRPMLQPADGPMEADLMKLNNINAAMPAQGIRRSSLRQDFRVRHLHIDQANIDLAGWTLQRTELISRACSEVFVSVCLNETRTVQYNLLGVWAATVGKKVTTWSKASTGWNKIKPALVCIDVKVLRWWYHPGPAKTAFPIMKTLSHPAYGISLRQCSWCDLSLYGNASCTFCNGWIHR